MDPVYIITKNITGAYNVLVITLFVTGLLCSQAQESTTDDSNHYAKGSQDIQPLSDQQGDANGDKFLIGPDGSSKCILNDQPKHLGKSRYMQKDENGECCCSLCGLGKYVESPCVCGEGSDVPSIEAQCRVVAIGQYMDKSNFCLMPYNCTPSCLAHQTLITECSRFADIKCQCEEGWYNPNKEDTGNIPRDCQQKPSCPNSGEEPRENANTDDEVTRTFSCRRCRDGHYKREGDGECKPHRVCQTKAGNEFEDNECLNDIPSVPESLGTTASPVTTAASPVTTAASPVTTAATQGSEDTDSGIKGDTCSCVLPWSFVIVFLILGVFLLILNCWQYRNNLRLKKEMKEQKAEAQQLQLLHRGADRE